jgi:hypothetical protein
VIRILILVNPFLHSQTDIPLNYHTDLHHVNTIISFAECVPQPFESSVLFNLNPNNVCVLASPTIHVQSSLPNAGFACMLAATGLLLVGNQSETSAGSCCQRIVKLQL